MQFVATKSYKTTMPLRVVKISIQHSQTYCLQVVSMLFTSAKYAVYEC